MPIGYWDDNPEHPHDFSLQTNLPVFKVKEASVRRRYSDFDWLKNELERDSKVCCKIGSLIK